jgi:hypothetical protein
MVHIPIKYSTNTYDIVPDNMLEALIMSLEISQFYRPSEKMWITIGSDAVRKFGEMKNYRGIERRASKR